jgi:hypothetical protein
LGYQQRHVIVFLLSVRKGRWRNFSTAMMMSDMSMLWIVVDTGRILVRQDLLASEELIVEKTFYSRVVE